MENASMRLVALTGEIRRNTGLTLRVCLLALPVLCAVPPALSADAGSVAVEPGKELPEGQHYPPGIELPAGEGRELLATACTRCHDLRGLPAFKDYWRRRQWGLMVETMVRNGAKLDPAQMEIVTDYLAEHFGPG